MSAASAFEYSAVTHVWRHGPKGYTNYESYREWLRDEFSFRCVFCLRREQWNIRLGSFHLDHFVPQSTDPGSSRTYENLLYVCAACNLKKGDLIVPHPCTAPFGECLRVNSDGTIEGLNAEGELLINILRLDDADHTRYRKMLLDTLLTLESHNREAYVGWMRFPDDLPDLLPLKPPDGNSRPAGIPESWFAKRQRRELPEVY
jgi:hypothetical protein